MLVCCQCGVLKEKLDSLLKTLDEEARASALPPQAPPPTIAEEQEEADCAPAPPPLPSSAPCSPRTNAPSSAAAIFKPREQLMLRANSLKKAIRQIIEHTERGGRGHVGGWGEISGSVVLRVFVLMPLSPPNPGKSCLHVS